MSSSVVLTRRLVCRYVFQDCLNPGRTGLRPRAVLSPGQEEYIEERKASGPFGG
jgi:hypothetical protein